MNARGRAARRSTTGTRIAHAARPRYGAALGTAEIGIVSVGVLGGDDPYAPVYDDHPLVVAAIRAGYRIAGLAVRGEDLASDLLGAEVADA